MNEGIHLDLDTWIVPGQIRKANLCRGLGNRYTPGPPLSPPQVSGPTPSHDDDPPHTRTHMMTILPTPAHT